MRNNYPTFPNPAGIGSQMGFEGPKLPQEQFIPMVPHPQLRLTPGPNEPDPIKASNSMYNPQRGQVNFNPWGMSAP